MPDDRNNGTKTGRDARGRFAPGNTGRPPGARHAATLAAEALLDGEAEALTRKAVEMALEGDPVALRLCMERVLSPRRDRPVRFALPAMATVADAPKALAAITAAVADGSLTASEAGDLAGLVEKFVKAIEVTDHEARIKAIEERNTT